MKQLFLAAILTALTWSPFARGDDWPQHRYDPGRTAASGESLPATLHLAWVRELSPPQPAFPTEIRLCYDATYAPVVLNKRLFVPSMVTNSVTALDTETGKELWRFFAEGPVRLAPAAWKNKVFFVSDDGFLYCVGASDGKLIWKFRGRPGDQPVRKTLGNGRLISICPARGGPVIADGVVYFAAGIWSGEGVYVHALDAKSGQAIWSNTESDLIEKANMDHGISYYAGLSPQGHLAIVDGRLVVPCGAQLPALLNLETGELETYTAGWGGRVGLPKGSAFVSGIGKYVVTGGDLYDIRTPNEEKFIDPKRKDFKRLLYMGAFTRLQVDRTNQKGMGDFRKPVLTKETLYCQENGIAAYDITESEIRERAKEEIPQHRKKDRFPDMLRAEFPERWRLSGSSRIHIKAGSRLYCGRGGGVEAIHIPNDGETAEICWQAELEGTPHYMLAADGKLFVVTREGRIYAFGEEEQPKPVTHGKPSAAAPKPDKWTTEAAEILKTTNVGDGYALMLTGGTGRLAEELVRQSKCDVIVIEPDAPKAAVLRRRFQQAGLYGTRISIYVGDPKTYALPPLMASLILSEDWGALGDIDKSFVKALFRSLRPYGATVALALPPAKRKAFEATVAECNLPEAGTRQTKKLVMLTRQGPLPGGADWSHVEANAANTNASEDRFAKAPLIRLWYDSSFRWMRKPGATEVRVSGGRMLVRGDRISAIDAYTGRLFWEAPLPPSYNGRDDEFVALEDALYFPAGRVCVELNPVTGEKSGQIELPSEVKGRWAHIRVAGDRLVGAADSHVVCMNRRSGELVWKHPRERSVGNIALGGGKVFCVDSVAKRLVKNASPPEVTTQALDLRTGKVLWEIPGAEIQSATNIRTGGNQWDTIGVAKALYSEPHDLLVTSNGVYHARDGKLAWEIGEVLAITEHKLLSGKSSKVTTYDLPQGEKSEKTLEWTRRGCTRLRVSENLLTTRYKGNASYIDLATGKITSIWNVRAACSNNIYPANGVLSLLNLSGGCTCNYMPISQAFAPVSVFE